MKLPLPAILPRRTRTDVRTFLRLMAALVGIVVLYSLAFHLLMLHEGQRHSWLTGFYWTLQTMSTLGYGDVVFTSDLGRMYAMGVLFTGVTILFIFLPFTLIQFFYAPWLEARSAARAPRELPADLSGHVLLTAHGPIEAALIDRLTQFSTPYAVIVPTVAQGLHLHDQGLQVMVGDIDDPQTYRRARVTRASLVATTLSDAANTNVALTVREISDTVPIVATAGWPNSVELLERAGCQQVIQLGEMLGRALALRIAGQDGRSHVVAELNDLVIAEAAAANTSLVGRTIRDLKLRDRAHVNVVGVWERGRYIVGAPDVLIRQDSILLLSGTREELAVYDRDIQAQRSAPRHVIIVGGGRVGRSTGRHLEEAGIDYRIVEMAGDHMRDLSQAVIGDATDPAILRQAGLERADSLAVTTREDDVNVYVTLQGRHLRPDLQILSRVTHERNIATLYRAGADVVLSYFPMEANAIFGVLRHGSLLLLAEGLDVFTVTVPKALAGRSMAESRVRQATGCNVLAVQPRDGAAVPIDPRTPLPAGAQMVVVGDREAARLFFETYGTT